MHYILLQCSTPTKIASLINERLGEGYKLSGSMFFRGDYLFQGMIKDTESIMETHKKAKEGMIKLPRTTAGSSALK